MRKNRVVPFLITGVLTVLLDYCVYSAIVAYSDVDTSAAKGVGFVSGTVFSYFVNRQWAFGDHTAPGARFLPFCLLYMSTLGLNVGVNELALHVLPASSLSANLAFLIATAVSSTANFLGMKYLVFPSSVGGT